MDCSTYLYTNAICLCVCLVISYDSSKRFHYVIYYMTIILSYLLFYF